MNIKKKICLAKIKINYKNLFVLAKKTLAESQKLLSVIEKEINNYPRGSKRLCSALYTQTTRLFQGVALLCNSGLDEEAKILTRSLLENVSYLLFIAEENHEERTKLYMHSRELSDAQAVKEFKFMRPEKGQELDDKHYKEREEEAIKYFRNKYGNDKSEKEIRKKYTLKPRNASEQIKKESIKKIFRITYGIFYRPASSTSHAEAPLEFVKIQNNGLQLKKYSSGKLTKICLQTSITLVLYAIDTLIEFLEISIKFPSDLMFNKLELILKNNEN